MPLITYKSSRLRESGLLDGCAPEILRCAQDGPPGCHPERSAGSLVDVLVITRQKRLTHEGFCLWKLTEYKRGKEADESSGLL